MSLLSRVRELVSADKNRFREGDHNLDLTYITERLVAMSFPAEGFESSYRNDIAAVARFLREKHDTNCMVFNLCSERGYNYALLDNRVQAWCGFPDHHAPPLALLMRLCHSIDTWLAQAPQHVAVVHCLAHDHEVLTSHGFLGMDAVRERLASGDPLLVAGYSAGHLVFEAPLAFVANAARVAQPMVAFSDGPVSVLVTPEHDMYCADDSGGGVKCAAAALVGQRTRMRAGFAMARGAVAALGRDCEWASWSVSRLRLAVTRRWCGRSHVRVATRRECDELVRMCMAAGYGASYRRGDGHDWMVALHVDEFVHLSGVHVAAHAGPTWCLTMPSGLLVARRVAAAAGAASRPVLVGNCKAGKGRTGTVVASYLVYCGLFASATPALNYFAHRRSSNMFGVSSPAQRRYVGYAAALVAAPARAATTVRRLVLSRVALTDLPAAELLFGSGAVLGGGTGDAAAELILEVRSVSQGKRVVHRSAGFVTGAASVAFAVNALLEGDIQIDVYCSRPALLGGKRVQKICFVQFHTALAPVSDAGLIVFGKSDCDKVAFDKRFPAAFALALHVEELELGAAAAGVGAAAALDAIVDSVRGAHAQPARVLFIAPAGGDAGAGAAELEAKVTDARGLSVASSAAAAARPIEKAGYLSKMGLTVRSWKERWFLLRGTTLAYYNSPKNTVPNGVIPLAAIWTVRLVHERVEATQPYPHALVLRTQERDYVLCTANLLDLEEWREAIQAAGQQLE